MDDGYRMERGWNQRKRWLWAEHMDMYRTVKGVTGTTYRVRMTAEEIEDRRKLGMFAALGLLVPVCIGILAAAAGLIG